ncbi:unnamed protein product [Prorocentrum cordatum]|uniref:Uncharacterized protein n=1 Tax=Prorocentrum cordatum TaxID=2364126 RepID=A0ABN9UU81_9DINO|nr:unnamed protein product [Polarella glacialis]
MWGANLGPDPISCNAGISACDRGGQWQQACLLIGEMRQARMAPDVISYSAGISACARGGQWQQALSLLSEMRQAKVEPNSVITKGLSRAGSAHSGSRLSGCSGI